MVSNWVNSGNTLGNGTLKKKTEKKKWAGMTREREKNNEFEKSLG